MANFPRKKKFAEKYTEIGFKNSEKRTSIQDILEASSDLAPRGPFGRLS
ncbi:hypothetical protein Q669_28435 [Labrenzia sp. C1B10]|jgi:hypothetical protein|nr:hypothetical protein Q669_28435 [Labrenzia sp. C1B10]ERS06422.1 hypothetical protein Q675_26905 [Labrenzia sp. C1B70]